MGDVEGGQAEVTTPLKTGVFNLNTVKLSKDTKGKDIFGVLCGTVCCYLPCALFSLALLNALSIFMIVIGAMYKDDCTARPNIGPVLIAMGAMAIVLSVLESLIRTKSSQAGSEPEDPPPAPSGIVRCALFINSLIKLIKFGLFIYLCVMVYGLYSDVVYDPEAGNEDYYCNRTFFLMVFWLLNITFIMIGVVIFFSICCCCCLLCLADK
jgi:hypothetical protein